MFLHYALTCTNQINETQLNSGAHSSKGYGVVTVFPHIVINPIFNGASLVSIGYRVQEIWHHELLGKWILRKRRKQKTEMETQKRKHGKKKITLATVLRKLQG